MPKKKPTTLILPETDELAFTVEQVVAKLPGDAIHNHLHRFNEQAKVAAENLFNLRTANSILIGHQLELLKNQLKIEQKTRLTWEAWLKQHCDFSRATAARYRNLAKNTLNGQLAKSYPSLKPELLPEQSLETLEKEQLIATMGALVEALNGVKVSELYEQLNLIAPPKPKGLGNKGGAKDKDPEEAPEPTAEETIALAEEDAISFLGDLIKQLRTFEKIHAANLKRPEREAFAKTLRDTADSTEQFKD